MIRIPGSLLVLAFVIASLCGQPLCAQSVRKVIIDQDAMGPATTHQQAILVILQAKNVETLGITVVTGDRWRDEEVAHTLRMLELIGHANIPVVPGTVNPPINTKEKTARWEKLYGRIDYQGAWNCVSRTHHLHPEKGVTDRPFSSGREGKSKCFRKFCGSGCTPGYPSLTPI